MTIPIFLPKVLRPQLRKLRLQKWSQHFGKIANIMISAIWYNGLMAQKSKIVWLMFYEKHEDLKMVPTSKYCGRLSLKIWGAHFILIAKAMVMAHLPYSSFLEMSSNFLPDTSFKYFSNISWEIIKKLYWFHIYVDRRSLLLASCSMSKWWWCPCNWCWNQQSWK